MLHDERDITVDRSFMVYRACIHTQKLSKHINDLAVSAM